jgi:hypothetical protein
MKQTEDRIVPVIDRREFLRQSVSLAGLASLAPRANAADSPAVTARLTADSSQPLFTVPADFTGLSYESAQLANPAFFSAQNTALIALFNELGAQGVLRIGGGTSEFTSFTAEDMQLPAPFEVVGPDTSKNIKSDTPITLHGLRNLRAFLDSAGWRCLYGLNLGRGSVANAAEEAAHAQQVLGPRLIALQLGNEPDAWRNRYRPASFTYADYWKEWWTARTAIRARVPQAVFAGPDISNKMDYVTGFAQDIKTHAAEVVLLTSHYYAMGPAGAKDVTLDKLLDTDPKLDKNLHTAVTAAHDAGISYRMCEGNSCWNGGQPGVSETLASALWVVEMMMKCASHGCSGVNLHGGGNGIYTPIAGSALQGFTRRPVFYGMKLLAPLNGANIISSNLDSLEPRISAYVADRAGTRFIVAINKSAKPTRIQVPLRSAHTQTVLGGTAIDAKDGVHLIPRAAHLRHGVIELQPYQATLIEGRA